MKKAFANVGGNGEFTCVNADFSSVTAMDQAFSGCTATSINLSGWNTTSVQRLGKTFGGLANARKINLSRWSADNATNIGYMFDGAKVVEEIDLGTNFNVSTSTDIDYWFYNTSATSKKTTLKCSRTTYDVIQKFVNDRGGRNSKKFLSQY